MKKIIDQELLQLTSEAADLEKQYLDLKKNPPHFDSQQIELAKRFVSNLRAMAITAQCVALKLDNQLYK